MTTSLKTRPKTEWLLGGLLRGDRLVCLAVDHQALAAYSAGEDRSSHGGVVIRISDHRIARGTGPRWRHTLVYAFRLLQELIERGAWVRDGQPFLFGAALGLLQRDGDVRFQMMNRLTAADLGRVIAENADLTCRLITDENPSYQRVGKAFEKGHETTNHSKGEYVRLGTDVHSNTIEGVFSLIKRGVMGTFHSVSAKHLPNYLNEFEFRWNTRKCDDGQRVAKAIRQVQGKRLDYRTSVDNPPYLVTVEKLRIWGRDYRDEMPIAADKQPKAPFEG